MKKFFSSKFDASFAEIPSESYLETTRQEQKSIELVDAYSKGYRDFPRRNLCQFDNISSVEFHLAYWDGWNAAYRNDENDLGRTE